MDSKFRALVYTAARGMLVNRAARNTDKIMITQVWAICPGAWPFYSTLRIGN